MTNVLEQAINTDDGDAAAKIVRQASASNPTTWPTTYSQRPGQPIVSGAPGKTQD
jgi:hypothetical protein